MFVSSANGTPGTSPGRSSSPGMTSTLFRKGSTLRRPVAVICGSGQRAAVGASLVQRFGAEEVVHVVEGGVPKWKKLGNPIEAGDE